MSDEYKIIILPEAQQDIREIALYIARELAAPQAALHFLDSLHRGVLSLSKMPERIKTVEESPWKDTGIRRVRIRNYYVYFLISETERTVKIMAVIYVGRDQEKQMSERGMGDSP